MTMRSGTGASAPLGSEAVVDLAAAFERFEELWSPRIVAQINEYDVKIVRAEGVFPEHAHEETDELFLVLEGRLVLRLPGREPVALRAGQLHVIPRGVRHRPVADPGTRILLLEPRGTLNTGDAGLGTTGTPLV
jgi:mannose-6-phosphate isomerase-like protein (cupin superfamily)